MFPFVIDPTLMQAIERAQAAEVATEDATTRATAPLPVIRLPDLELVGRIPPRGGPGRDRRPEATRAPARSRAKAEARVRRAAGSAAAGARPRPGAAPEARPEDEAVAAAKTK